MSQEKLIALKCPNCTGNLELPTATVVELKNGGFMFIGSDNHYKCPSCGAFVASQAQLDNAPGSGGSVQIKGSIVQGTIVTGNLTVGGDFVGGNKSTIVIHSDQRNQGNNGGVNINAGGKKFNLFGHDDD